MFSDVKKTCATEDEAVAHLIEFWAKVPQGQVYPGYSGDSTFGQDFFLMKVRFRDANGDKYGALVAIDEDAHPPIDPGQVAKRVGAHFNLPLEYRTSTHQTTVWAPTPNPE